jgi:hypothetical protein
MKKKIEIIKSEIYKNSYKKYKNNIKMNRLWCNIFKKISIKDLQSEVLHIMQEIFKDLLLILT